MESTIHPREIYYLTPKDEPAFTCTPVLRVLLFSLLTLGAYSFWWHYKNWRKVQQDAEPTISPFFRALVFPFYAYSLYDLVAGTSKSVTGRSDFLLYFFGVANFVTKVAFLLSGINPMVALIVHWLAVLVLFDLVYVQYRINEINKTIGRLDFSWRIKGMDWVVILLFVWWAGKLIQLLYMMSK